MPIVCYHSTLISSNSPLPPSRSSKGPTGTTSCQILLSRGVSDVSDTSRIHPGTEAPQISIATIFESRTHHIMALGEPARHVGAVPTKLDTMDDFGGGVEHVESQKHPIRSDLDGSMAGLYTPPIEISTPSVPHGYTDLRPKTSHESISECGTPIWKLTPAESFQPDMKKIDKGKGKEVDRGRTNDRTYRAANPTVRAESHPRRLDPSFELISQPNPVRPLPIERRTERLGSNTSLVSAESTNLSRSSTFHKDPSEQCATLDDELLDQCPISPICPLTEVLNAPAVEDEDADVHVDQHFPNAESAGTDTPSPITGLFRSDSNGLYQMKLSRISDTKILPTAYNEKPALYPSPTLPPAIASRIMPNLSRLEYLALQSSTKEWSGSPYDAGDDESTPVRDTGNENERAFPPASSFMASLPVEIILQIYSYIGPSDFNSVRRVNRRWFISSLDKGILRTMLRRGGWSSSSESDFAMNSVIEENRRVKVNDEWLMSKKIARECALGPDWTGNGVDRLLSPTYPGITDFSGVSPKQEDANSPGRTAFRLTTTTDFTEIGIHYPNATPGAGASGAGTTFTVSICGRFLMVANGCLIYIYELNQSRDPSQDDRAMDPGELKPVTSIICPRRVLACSMDTSSHRYAIAVLLDGRMGLVCDITAPGTGSPRARSNSNSTVTAMGSTYTQAGPSTMGRGNSYYGHGNYRNNITINSSTSNAFERAVSEKAFVFPVIATHDSQHASRDGAPDFKEGAWQDMLQGDLPSSSIKPLSDSSTAFGNPPPIPGVRPFPTATATAMPLEYGPRSIYRNLCSDDDPPRSVAICPQRRCVAFGCSAGIELHWVDALTGQDLNRWFPLTAPSDFLFFLPPRRGVDSAKKLRLISSAACPAESPALADRFRSSSVTPGTTRSGSRPFGLRHASERAPPILPGALRSDDSDHYRAVPLSDGYHILFTNPVTGVLCLGSDAPIGGPTKLLRKIWFMGPKGQDRNRPIAYAAGSDLRSGIRIVAAYENGDDATQSVWLFSIPCDVFRDSQAEQGVAMKRERHSEGEWRDWWSNEFGEDDWRNPENSLLLNSTPLSAKSNWPVQVRGQEIGSCVGLVDLAIHAGPDMNIWAFTRAGTAMVWQIDNGNSEQVGIRRRVVLRDGTIRETDEDGDIEMLESNVSDVGSLNVELSTPSNFVLPDPLAAAESFDGTASTHNSPLTGHPIATHHRFLEEETETRVTRNVDVVDGDGDVLMADLLPDVWVRISEFHGDGEEGLGRGRAAGEGSGEGRALYRSTRWAGRFVEQVGGGGADLVEELTGMARMEIEIR